MNIPNLMGLLTTSYTIYSSKLGIDSKYFTFLQVSNAKYSGSYGEYFKCSKNGKDDEAMANLEVQLVLYHLQFKMALYYLQLI